MARKDLLTRLADAGEEAIGRLADAPGADRLVGAMNSLRERVDELQKRVRGIDALEARVAELERRLDELAPAQRPPRSPARATGASGATGGTRKRSSTAADAAVSPPARRARRAVERSAEVAREEGDGSPGGAAA